MAHGGHVLPGVCHRIDYPSLRRGQGHGDGHGVVRRGHNLRLVGEPDHSFLESAFALGLGWNFAFIWAFTFLTETYAPSEKAKAQALHDFLVFGMVTLASLTSGTILYFLDWRAVNFAAIPAIGVALIATLWLMGMRRP